MKEAKTRFYLDSRKNKNGKQRILVDISIRSTKLNAKNMKRYSPITISSGCTIEQSLFGDSGTRFNKDKFKKNAIHNSRLKRIKKELENIEQVVEDISYDFYKENITPTREEFKKALNVALEREKKQNEQSVLEYLNNVIQQDRKAIEENKDTPRGLETIKSYVSLSKMIENYQIAVNSTVMFKDFTNKFYWDFFEVCDKIYRDEIKVVNPNQKKKLRKSPYGYGAKSINKIGKTLKALLRMAILDGYNVPLVFNDKRNPLSLKIKKKPTKPILLSEAELIKIINADVSSDPVLLNTQQYIIIASLTGLRVGDMCKLHKLTVKQFNNELKAFIGVDTDIKKVNSEAIAPLLKHVRDILSANGGKFPKFEERAVNIGMKRLGQLLKIDDIVEVSKLSFRDKEYKIIKLEKYKTLTTHVCRHSFVSNLALHGVDEKIIMALTHPKKTDSESNMFNVYFKADNAYKSSRLLKAIEKIDSKVYTYD